MGEFFEGYTASALRSVLVLLILVPIAAGRHRLEPLQLGSNWPYASGMFVASLFTWGPLYYAILHAGVGISLAVAYASIVIGSFLFGRLFAQENLTKDKTISAALGIIGLALIFSPTMDNLGWLALVAALVSGLSAAANTVFSKKVTYDATQSTMLLWTASLIANALMAFVLSESHPAIGWHAQWFYLVIFAAASLIASWSLIKGVKLIDAGSAGILGLLEIVFGVLFGVLFFNEKPNLMVLTGMATIIAAATVPYYRDQGSTQTTDREARKPIETSDDTVPIRSGD